MMETEELNSAVVIPVVEDVPLSERTLNSGEELLVSRHGEDKIIFDEEKKHAADINLEVQLRPLFQDEKTPATPPREAGSDGAAAMSLVEPLTDCPSTAEVDMMETEDCTQRTLLKHDEEQLPSGNVFNSCSGEQPALPLSHVALGGFENDQPKVPDDELESVYFICSQPMLLQAQTKGNGTENEEMQYVHEPTGLKTPPPAGECNLEQQIESMSGPTADDDHSQQNLVEEQDDGTPNLPRKEAEPLSFVHPMTDWYTTAEIHAMDATEKAARVQRQVEEDNATAAVVPMAVEAYGDNIERNNINFHNYPSIVITGQQEEVQARQAHEYASTAHLVAPFCTPPRQTIHATTIDGGPPFGLAGISPVVRVVSPFSTSSSSFSPLQEAPGVTFLSLDRPLEDEYEQYGDMEIYPEDRVVELKRQTIYARRRLRFDDNDSGTSTSESDMDDYTIMEQPDFSALKEEEAQDELEAFRELNDWKYEKHFANYLYDDLCDLVQYCYNHAGAETCGAIAFQKEYDRNHLHYYTETSEAEKNDSDLESEVELVNEEEDFTRYQGLCQDRDRYDSIAAARFAEVAYLQLLRDKLMEQRDKKKDDMRIHQKQLDDDVDEEQNDLEVDDDPFVEMLNILQKLNDAAHIKACPLTIDIVLAQRELRLSALKDGHAARYAATVAFIQISKKRSDALAADLAVLNALEAELVQKSIEAYDNHIESRILVKCLRKFYPMARGMYAGLSCAKIDKLNLRLMQLLKRRERTYSFSTTLPNRSNHYEDLLQNVALNFLSNDQDAINESHQVLGDIHKNRIDTAMRCTVNVDAALAKAVALNAIENEICSLMYTNLQYKYYMEEDRRRAAEMYDQDRDDEIAKQTKENEFLGHRLRGSSSQENKPYSDNCDELFYDPDEDSENFVRTINHQVNETTDKRVHEFLNPNRMNGFYSFVREALSSDDLILPSQSLSSFLSKKITLFTINTEWAAMSAFDRARWHFRAPFISIPGSTYWNIETSLPDNKFAPTEAEFDIYMDDNKRLHEHEVVDSFYKKFGKKYLNSFVYAPTINTLRVMPQENDAEHDEFDFGRIATDSKQK